MSPPFPLRAVWPRVVGLLLAFLLWAMGGTSAAWALDLRSTDRQHLAWPDLTMRLDPGRTLTLADMLREPDRFVRPSTPESNFGPRSEALWLRLAVTVQEGDGHWVMDIDYALLDQVQVYLVRDGQLVSQHLLGAQRAYAAREFRTRSNAQPLDLTPRVPYTIYLRVLTHSATVVPISFMTPDRFREREEGVHLIQGMMMGMAGTLLAYSLLHWVFLRNALFGWYALTVLGAGGFSFQYFGITQQYLGYATTGLMARFSPLATFVAMGAVTQFVALALHTRAHEPRLATWLNRLSWLAVTGFVLTLLDAITYRQAQLLASVLGPLAMALVIPAAIFATRRKDPAGVYMLFGWAVYAATGSVMSALINGLIPANAWTLQVFQLGGAVEMLAWLRVLGLYNEASLRSAERSEVERQTLQQMARTDMLTGLPNRRGLQLDLSVALAKRPQGLAVYYIDLDGFKPVNDSLGHDAGDALLIEVGQRLQQQLRHTDSVGRIGGDEFVVVASHLPNDAEAETLGRKFLQAFEQPFMAAGQPQRIGLTVGLALAPHDGQDAEALLRAADQAMYDGKRAGGHCVRRFQARV